MAKYEKYDDEDGVWRTVGGRRIFIRNGQALSDAMKESGKFKTKKSNNETSQKSETAKTITKETTKDELNEKKEETRGERIARTYKNISDEERQKIIDFFNEDEDYSEYEGTHFEGVGSERQKAMFSHQEELANEFFQKLNNMKKNLEELKTNPQKHYERVLEEKVTPQRAREMQEDDIKGYQRAINKWENDTKPTILRGLKYLKDYEKYLKEHPESEMNYFEFRRKIAK